MITTGSQIRAGRALLGWKQEDLARAADLHVNAVAFWERRGTLPPDKARLSYAIHHIGRAFREAGIETFAEPTPGVRFMARAQIDSRRHAACRVH